MLISFIRESDYYRFLKPNSNEKLSQDANFETWNQTELKHPGAKKVQ